MKPSIGAGAVARTVFGKTLDWFYRKRESLETQHGFPAPVALSHPMVYDPDLIAAWRQGRYDARGSAFIQRTATPEPVDDGEQEDLEAAREEIRGRIPGLAAPAGKP